MRNLYSCETKVGPVFIAVHGGRFHPIIKDESLGSYATPQQAAEDLAGGHTFTPKGGIDTASLEIPGDLSEWTVLECGLGKKPV